MTATSGVSWLQPSSGTCAVPVYGSRALHGLILSLFLEPQEATGSGPALEKAPCCRAQADPGVADP